MDIGAIVIFDGNKLGRVLQVEGDDLVLGCGPLGLKRVNKDEAVEIYEIPAHACWFCNGSLIWQSDFTFEDYDYEGEGLIAVLQCSRCGAMVEFARRDDDEGATH